MKEVSRVDSLVDRLTLMSFSHCSLSLTLSLSPLSPLSPQAQELDRQAKAHMGETFRLSLEEKEEKISVLQTQVHQMD